MGLRYSKLSRWPTGQLFKRFVVGSMVRTAPGQAGVHRNTAAMFFPRLRGLSNGAPRSMPG
jgi:hypothetical protein